MWNKPLYKPIPPSIEGIYKLFLASKAEYSNIIMETLLKSIDLSRLSVTALDNNKNKMEKINIVTKDSNLLIYIFCNAKSYALL